MPNSSATTTTTSVSELLARIRGPIERDLSRVDRVLSQLLDTPVELIPAIQRHAVSGGGKKIRPALLLLSARLVTASRGEDPGRDGGQADEDSLVSFAAACETVHLASLIHDDVADGAELRRGGPTANQRWRNKTCVFAADYLFASIYSTLSTPQRAPLLRRLSLAVNRMCDGEVLQAVAEGNPEATEEDYLAIIRGKTAALMAVACEIGALLADARPDRANWLARFGEDFGMAFQITDDLLDWVGQEEEMGKRPGSDLRNGRFTLPIIRLRDGLTGAARGEVIRLLARHRELAEDEVLGLRRRLVDSGALASVQRTAGEFADRAQSRLADFPPGEAREALGALCEFLLMRRH